MSKHPKLILMLGVIISVISLWLAFRHSNVDDFITTLARVHYWMALPMLITYGLFYGLKVLRWKFILQPIKRTRIKDLFSSMMLGFFGNNVLPAHMGEFIRMYIAAKDLELSNTQVLATLVLERIFDILSIVVILLVVLSFGVDLSDDLENAGLYASIIAFVFITGITLSVVWTSSCLFIIEKILFWLPEKIRDRILKHIKLAMESFHAIKSPSLLLAIIATSLLQWLFMGATIYIALLSVDISASLAACFVVLSFTVFAVIVPAAPGFFGTIQLAFVLSLMPFGISEVNAIAASISFHVITYFSVLFLGFYLLHRRGFSIKTLTQDSQTAT